MAVVNDIEDIVFAYPHNQGADSGRILHAHLEYCRWRNTAGRRRNLDCWSFKIPEKNIACDSESANHDSDDYRGKHASSLHGNSFMRESNLAYTTRFIKMDNSKKANAH